MTPAPSPPSASPPEPPGWRARALAALVLLGWLAADALALTKLPHGFALGSLRFLLHDALPWVIAGVGVMALVGLVRPPLTRAALEGLGALALSAAAGMALAFPRSVPVFPWALGALGVVTLASSLALRRAEVRLAGRIAALALGGLAGAVVPAALRAPDPSTRPAGPDALPAAPAAFEPADRAALGLLHLAAPAWSLELDPFFTVESRSPDRFWTALAPDDTRHSTTWQLLAREASADATRTWWGSDDGAAAVAWRHGDAPTLDASFRLDGPVYAHLATWARARFAAREARVRFSPCGDAEIEVRPSDYPEGRPARFAYLTADDRFVVAEASSGEKGPFRELCAGPLSRGAPLTLFFVHREGEVAVTFLDFSAQASTEPSPTAGWGVPQNAIQLMREANAEDGAVIAHFALAATGVGRGWDTVGLAAGTYRNRVRVATGGAARQP